MNALNILTTAASGVVEEGAIGDTPLSSFPDKWYDLWKLEEPLNWEAFLESELLAKQRSNTKTVSIIAHISASISIISSLLIIVHVLRSHQGLSTTYHRLLIGLSIADIIFSFFDGVRSTMVPKDVEYFMPGAKGDVDTCTTQGFFLHVSVGISVYYNCSICIYYFTIINYNKSDAYITKKLEHWLHVIPIAAALLSGFLAVAVNDLNAWGNKCFVVPYNPPHCIGFEDGHIVDGFSIPCGRGNAFHNSFFYQLLAFFFTAPPPIIILMTMIMMYRTVVKIERNAARYGVRTLRLNVQQATERIESDLNEDSSTPTLGIRSSLVVRGIVEKIQDVNCLLNLCRLLTCRNNNSHAYDAGARRRPKERGISKRVSRKKAILQMASGYVAALVLVYVPGFLYIQHPSFVTAFMNNLFTPLQGLFNFIVFMCPKVRAARNRPRRGQSREEGKLSFFKAILKAYMSRGERSRRL